MDPSEAPTAINFPSGHQINFVASTTYGDVITKFVLDLSYGNNNNNYNTNSQH